MTVPAVEKTGSLWKGQVVSVSPEGHLVTNFLTKDVVPLSKSSKVWFELAGAKTPATIRGLVSTYNDVEKGKLMAIGGSSGYIEICRRDGSAAQTTGLEAGSSVTIQFRV